jgi:hypothetical protein
MPLHLLHHKSWHVYNTDNIEKVRRDQETARRKEEEDEMRMNQADQERRLQQLRGNAYNTERPTPIDISKPSNTIPGLRKSNKHINFFEDLEKVEVAQVEGNPARQAEKAAENKKWEDMITSKFVNATSDHKPWYSQLDKVSTKEKDKSEGEKELKEKKQAKWKDSADPLKQMERYLEKKKDVNERERWNRERLDKVMTERERRGRGRTPENTGRGEERRNHKRLRSRSRSPRREHRRHRRHHRSRSPATDLERLRAEREIREAVEKERIDRLLRNEKKNDQYQSVGYHGYSAQFNPDAVRR